jgi:hypothetical protein
MTKRRSRKNIREMARLEHERLLRDDPVYRAQWEKVTSIWFTVLADAKLPEFVDGEHGRKEG